MVNFGISGTRSIHHYFSFKKNLGLKPDIVIFLLGVNDWNYHIVNIDKKIIFPFIEIAFDYRTSILHKISSKITSSVKKKFFTKKSISKNLKKSDSTNPFKDIIQKNINLKNKIEKNTNLDLDRISTHYEYWLDKIIKICKKRNIKCIFADQPSLYNLAQKKNNEDKLWMNPPYRNFKISFEDMVKIKNMYNLFL